MIGNSTEPMGLSPRLQDLGFVHDPFDYAEAEKMPEDMVLWERLFVEHPGFNEIRNINQSAILLAERGGGKTAHRLYFANMLADQYPNWLVVNYLSFTPLADKLPNIRTSDHFSTLIRCIAGSLLDHIQKNHHQTRFLEQPLPERKWIWAFLNTYLVDKIEYELQDNALQTDFAQLGGSSLAAPFQQNVSLDEALKTIVRHLNSINITRLFVLIDGVDGSSEFNDLSSMAALVNPLLNGVSLLSIADIVWKFFLPKALEQIVYCSSGYETGRLHRVQIQWDHESLIELLNARLRWASNGFHQRIENFCSQELLTKKNVAEELMKMASRHKYLGPPRALLKLSRQMLS